MAKNVIDLIFLQPFYKTNSLINGDTKQDKTK